MAQFLKFQILHLTSKTVTYLICKWNCNTFKTTGRVSFTEGMNSDKTFNISFHFIVWNSAKRGEGFFRWKIDFVGCINSFVEDCSFKTNFGPFGSTLVPKNFFCVFYLSYMLEIIARYCMQFQGKIKNQTWGNGKKPSFRTNFGPFDSNLDPKKFFMNFFTSTKC